MARIKLQSHLKESQKKAHEKGRNRCMKEARTEKERKRKSVLLFFSFKMYLESISELILP